jgi:hypothetical protein
MLNTSGTINASNITERRSINVATADDQQIADLLGTLVYDIQEGLYDGANYAITGTTTDNDWDMDDTDSDEVLDVLGTSILDNPGTATFTGTGTAIANAAYADAIDCQNTEMLTVARVLAKVLSTNWDRQTQPDSLYSAASVGGGRSGCASVGGGRSDYASVGGGRADYASIGGGRG